MTNTPTRHADIDLDSQSIPEGMTLIEGKRLPVQAKLAGINYGHVKRKMAGVKGHISEGIYIATEDVPKIEAQLKVMEARRK